MKTHTAATGSPVSSVAYGNAIVASPRISATPAARPSDAPRNRAKRNITTHIAEISSPVVNTVVRYVTNAQYTGSCAAFIGSSAMRKIIHGISAV